MNKFWKEMFSFCDFTLRGQKIWSINRYQLIVLYILKNTLSNLKEKERIKVWQQNVISEQVS